MDRYLAFVVTEVTKILVFLVACEKDQSIADVPSDSPAGSVCNLFAVLVQVVDIACANCLQFLCSS